MLERRPRDELVAPKPGEYQIEEGKFPSEIASVTEIALPARDGPWVRKNGQACGTSSARM